MTYQDEDVIHVLTKKDVDDVARDMGLENLAAEHYRSAREFFENFCDGPYTWRNAVEDGLRRAEDELSEKGN